MRQAELRQIRELQQWLARNSGMLRAIHRALQSYQQSTQHVAAWYVDANRRMAATLGRLDWLREAALLVGQAFLGYIESLPPNWPLELNAVKAIEVANAGIPVVWVPSASVMIELVDAEDHEARLAVLRTHEAEISGDIEKTLAEVTHPSLAGQVPLARKAYKAWRDGHSEAAQALAVTVVEALVRRYFAKGRKYPQVREAARLDLEGDLSQVASAPLRLAIAMAPIWAFYAPWYPETEQPMPEHLSRHVTVHQADVAHYTADNVMIAVLLQASMLRAFQELLEQQDAEAAE